MARCWRNLRQVTRGRSVCTFAATDRRGRHGKRDGGSGADQERGGHGQRRRRKRRATAARRPWWRKASSVATLTAIIAAVVPVTMEEGVAHPHPAELPGEGED